MSLFFHSFFFSFINAFFSLFCLFLSFFLSYIFLYRKSSMRSYFCVRIWVCVKPSNYNKKINWLKYFKYSVSFFLFYIDITFVFVMIVWNFEFFSFFFSVFFVYKHPLIVTLAFMTPAHTGHLLKFVESEKFHRTSIANI